MRMNAKDAAAVLENIRSGIPKTDGDAHNALQMGIDILKKQVAIRPKAYEVHSENRSRSYWCPSCGALLDDPTTTNKIPRWLNDTLHCEVCGQAIDWSKKIALTKEDALKYHRQMWTDMQKDIGNTCSGDKREEYKEKWCRKHFPGIYIMHSCFCCEYDSQKGNGNCEFCPIKWPVNLGDGMNCCSHGPNNDKDYFYYLNAPISEILALPEDEIPEKGEKE